MKRHIREFVGFFGIFFSLFCFIAAFTFASGDILSPGQKLFESKCAQCHGKDAKGMVKMAKVLKVEPVAIDLTRDDAVKLTTADKIKIVTGGKKKMPKFNGKLTDEQIQETVKYLETLQTSGGSKK